MKQSVKIILLVVLLAAVLCGAYFGYRALSPKLQPEAEPSATQQASDALTDDAADPSAQPAEPAADFSVVDRDGNTVKLSEKFGKPIVLNFWASWCGPCKSELPAFDAAAKAHADDIEFLMVNLTDGYQETQADVDAFLAETGYTFPVYYDLTQQAAVAYGVYSIPLTVFIAADGTVVRQHTGVMSETQLSAGIDALLH